MTLIAHVFTSSKFVPFVLPVLVGLKERGYDLCTISGDGPELRDVEDLGITVHRVEMTRAITPMQDFRALLQLTSLLRKVQPNLVHVHNPKAGVIGTMAASLAGRLPSIYHVHGSPLLTAAGWRWALFWLTESLSHSLAKVPLAVSPSLSNALLAQRVAGAGRTRVLGCGSVSGIDVEKFTVQKDRNRGRALRAQHQIPAEALVVGFAGRLILEKGIRELEAAWAKVAEEFPSAFLLVAGSPDGIEPKGATDLFRGPQVVRLGQVSDMVSFYEALDVFVLPSYREGLSTVLLEALSCQLPIVAARAVGTIDVIHEGFTGMLVPPRDVNSLAVALQTLLQGAELRRQLGAAGRVFVEQSFERAMVLDALVAFYTELGFAPP